LNAQEVLVCYEDRRDKFNEIDSLLWVTLRSSLDLR